MDRLKDSIVMLDLSDESDLDLQTPAKHYNQSLIGEEQRQHNSKK